MTVDEYIKKNWIKCVNYNSFHDLNLPCSYVAPSFEGDFKTLYYWDTYFINKGLIIDGFESLALNNVNCLLRSLEYFRCVPNYVKENGDKWSSQAPLLFMMVHDVDQIIHDEEWLKNAVLLLEKEYRFWMNHRMTSIGLNQYGYNEVSKQDYLSYYQYFTTRVPLDSNISDERKIELAKNFMGICESGEDVSPRFIGYNSLDLVEVDLNSHLYGLEEFLEQYYHNKDEDKSLFYKKSKEKRKALLIKYCYDKERKIFTDYNFKKGCRTNIVGAYSFMPFFHNIVDESYDASILYHQIKCKAGVTSTANYHNPNLQWAYPYLWAPHQFFAYIALMNNKKIKEAEELKKNFTKLIEKVYEKRHYLYERYVEDDVAKDLEYPTQKMLGWTAGVYKALKYQWKEK